MKDMHPEWEFLFFSDGDSRNFVVREFPEFLALYDWYPRPVLKADLFRLLVVYRLGGFYLDTDFMLTKSLDPLCVHDAVFAWEHELDVHSFDIRYPAWMKTREERWTLANYAFGAKPGHPFLRAILDELVNRTATFEAEHCNDLDVLHATGPDAVTTVYYRQREQWNDVVLLKSPVMGLGDYGVHLIHGGWRHDHDKD